MKRKREADIESDSLHRISDALKDTFEQIKTGLKPGPARTPLQASAILV